MRVAEGDSVYVFKNFPFVSFAVVRCSNLEFAHSHA